MPSNESLDAMRDSSFLNSSFLFHVDAIARARVNSIVRRLRAGDTMRYQTWFRHSAIAVGLLLSACSVSEQALPPRSERQPASATPATADWSSEIEDSAVFREFWASFLQAVEKDDRPQLYLVTRHSKFHWEPSDLGTPRQGGDNYFYKFQEFGDFDRACPKIFTPAVRAKILAERPGPSYAGGYEICWGDRRCKYTLMFVRDSDGLYRFAGALCGIP